MLTKNYNSRILFVLLTIKIGLSFANPNFYGVVVPIVNHTSQTVNIQPIGGIETFKCDSTTLRPYDGYTRCYANGDLTKRSYFMLANSFTKADSNEVIGRFSLWFNQYVDEDLFYYRNTYQHLFDVAYTGNLNNYIVKACAPTVDPDSASVYFNLYDANDQGQYNCNWPTN